MSNKTNTVCDQCEYEQIGDDPDRYMKKCKICKQDLCDECQHEHAEEHCGWN